MQYLLTIYNSAVETASNKENGALMQEYGDFTRGIIASGHYKGRERVAAREHCYFGPRA